MQAIFLCTAKMNAFIRHARRPPVNTRNPLFTSTDGSLAALARLAQIPWRNQDRDARCLREQRLRAALLPGSTPPGGTAADWGWVQHMYASLEPGGRMAVVLNTRRGEPGTGGNKDRTPSRTSASSCGARRHRRGHPAARQHVLQHLARHHLVAQRWMQAAPAPMQARFCSSTRTQALCEGPAQERDKERRAGAHREGDLYTQLAGPRKAERRGQGGRWCATTTITGQPLRGQQRRGAATAAGEEAVVLMQGAGGGTGRGRCQARCTMAALGFEDWRGVTVDSSMVCLRKPT
ncbi:MAG: N-6 DNA methylase [Caldilineaceae bacterium]|nr:N-6 DNA methylase [Caldilineaceae bacterium]